MLAAERLHDRVEPGMIVADVLLHDDRHDASLHHVEEADARRRPADVAGQKVWAHARPPRASDRRVGADLARRRAWDGTGTPITPPSRARASRRRPRRVDPPPVGPHVPGSYGCTGVGVFRIGSTTCQAASTASSRANSIASPSIASPSSRSYASMSSAVRMVHHAQLGRLGLEDSGARLLHARAQRDLHLGAQAEADVDCPRPARDRVSGGRFRVTSTSVVVTGRRLAGADEERHALPSPRVDVEPHGAERLHLRVRRDARLREVALNWPRTRSSGSSGRIIRNTFTCSSRIDSWYVLVGGSMARKPTTCSMWFWITSRIAPVSS